MSLRLSFVMGIVSVPLPAPLPADTMQVARCRWSTITMCYIVRARSACCTPHSGTHAIRSSCKSSPGKSQSAGTSIYRRPKSGKLQLWYQAYAGKRAGDKRLQCVVRYTEWPDGINFAKPPFDLHPFKEHQKTNIVLVGNGGYGDR